MDYFSPDEFIQDMAVRTGWSLSTDAKYVDTDVPFFRTPAFLMFSDRERYENPFVCQQMEKSFKFSGNPLLTNPIYRYGDDPRPYKNPVNEYMNKHYPMQNIRVLEKGNEWGQSMAMTLTLLGDGYKLFASQADPRTLENNNEGYYFLCLLFRNKEDARKYPQTGAARLVQFLKTLEQMPQAPAGVAYEAFAETNSFESPHLKHLDLEFVHQTRQLEKIWQRKLGGVETGFEKTWLATRYNPVDPRPVPKELQIPEYEKILRGKKCYAR